MPTTPLTEHGVPRSALRYRPLQTEEVGELIPPFVRVSRASRLQHKARTKRIATEITADPLPAESARTCSPRSARRPTYEDKSRQSLLSRLRIPGGERIAKPQRSLAFMLGMLMTLLLLLLSLPILAWSHTLWNDLHYGRPRTFQIDAFVGHETGKEPSHFIALNLHGRLEVIELPGGDAAHARIYAGPQLSGPSADLVPVTLQFVSTAHSRQPNMIMHFGDGQLIFYNDQGSYHPAN
ncbi:hypothetical protein EPA93_02010 [Ktedonosporobacter rubrisoli]|uniref:Uncharacterized protein n=1 Tax=Ktedonosporobacter rubrisoli TaxID=2509675 RepID=A0A4P6JIU5_KTERU|nr:hypothetical protein [Ktedonosporobacter rubrisoli]QBD74832.1 hypothetical protein EPA93_02010 [Ktedonosporobacter rubrisoli]